MPDGFAGIALGACPPLEPGFVPGCEPGFWPACLTMRIDLPLELLDVLRSCSMIVSRFLTISACFFRVSSPVSGS